MASKRRIPFEAPNNASSSTGEDDSVQSDVEEKQEQQQPQHQDDAVEEEDEDEDESGEEEDDEDEDEEEDKSSEKNSTVPSATNPPNPTSQSGSDSESGSESESDVESGKTPPSPNVSDFTIKPITSKPMKDSDKPTKPNNKKRAMETEPSRTKKQKQASNGSGGDEEGEGDNGVEENAKKGGSGVPRLWSSDDEIAILKGMIEYQSKKGTILNSDMEAFHEFIKKSLHVEVSKNQLIDKVRRLKKKYHTIVEKGEKGEDPVFSNPHEGKSFELSKKVWGSSNDGKKNNAVIGGSVIKNKTKANNVANNVSVLALPIQEGVTKQQVIKNWVVKRETKREVGSFESSYPCLNEVVESGTYFDLTVPVLGKVLMKQSISLVESSKVKELEKKWKKLMVDETDVYLKKVELIEEQTKLVLDAMRTSSS